MEHIRLKDIKILLINILKDIFFEVTKLSGLTTDEIFEFLEEIYLLSESSNLYLL